MNGNIAKLTPFDASKRALEGTTNFRENANYSWGWLAQHAIEVNALVDDLNIYKNGLKDILTAYVQENLEESVVNRTTLGIDKIDNTADKDKNVLTATKLTTPRTIGGVSFDGSANINLPGVNTEGNQNTTGSAAKLTTPRTIGGVSFDGSSNINLPGVNTEGNQNTTGSAAKLTTPRTITISGAVNGSVTFDGSANINISTSSPANSVGDYALVTVATNGAQYSNTNVAGSSLKELFFECSTNNSFVVNGYSFLPTGRSLTGTWFVQGTISNSVAGNTGTRVAYAKRIA